MERLRKACVSCVVCRVSCVVCRVCPQNAPRATSPSSSSRRRWRLPTGATSPPRSARPTTRGRAPALNVVPFDARSSMFVPAMTPVNRPSVDSPQSFVETLEARPLPFTPASLLSSRRRAFYSIRSSLNTYNKMSALTSSFLGTANARVCGPAARPSPNATRSVTCMAKKKGIRVIVTLECTEARSEGGTPSRVRGAAFSHVGEEDEFGRVGGRIGSSRPGCGY